MNIKIKWESKGKFAIHCKLLIIIKNNIYNIYNGSIYTYILFISIFYCIYIHMNYCLFLFLYMCIYTKNAPNRPKSPIFAIFSLLFNNLKWANFFPIAPHAIPKRPIFYFLPKIAHIGKLDA